MSRSLGIGILSAVFIAANTVHAQPSESSAAEIVQQPESVDEQVRELDISPEEAAAYLRDKKGVKVFEDQFGYYRSVTLKRDWFAEPKDWLYIANLARENKSGERHSINISIDGPADEDTLVECFKCFRKSKNSPFVLFLFEARLNRESLSVLGSYPGLTSLSANQAADDITDEDWAACISAWPNAYSLFLNPNGGRKSIAAASKLEHLRILKFRNANPTEVDLEPMRSNMKLEVLWVWDGNGYTQYLNQDGTGKWQVK